MWKMFLCHLGSIEDGCVNMSIRLEYFAKG